MLSTNEIERMSVSERLQMIELLWSSITRTAENVPSPDWHGEVVAGRLAKIKEGKAKFMTVEEVKQRLKRR